MTLTRSYVGEVVHIGEEWYRVMFERVEEESPQEIDPWEVQIRERKRIERARDSRRIRDAYEKARGRGG